VVAAVVVAAVVVTTSSNNNPSAENRLKLATNTAIAVLVFHVRPKHSQDQATVRVREQDQEQVSRDKASVVLPEEHERASKLGGKEADNALKTLSSLLWNILRVLQEDFTRFDLCLPLHLTF
jgi:hypothetical protein